jgi:hypothetical protein
MRRRRARRSAAARYNSGSDLPLVIPEEAKERLRILFVAKHALWDAGLHPEDGNHALYHVEVREILKGLGLKHLSFANRYDVTCSTSRTSISSSRCSTAAASSTARC